MEDSVDMVRYAIPIIEGLTRRERLKQIEWRIAAYQAIIDSTVSELSRMRDMLPELIQKAKAAVDEQQRLFVAIEDEGLWQGDYESADAYMDARGFSRQRQKQVRDLVKVMSLVNTVDAILPPPTDRQARILTTLTNDETIKKVYQRAVKDAKGRPPPLSRIEFLSGAAADGIDVNDDNALKLWEEEQTIDQIVRLWKKLSESGQARVMTLI